MLIDFENEFTAAAGQTLSAAAAGTKVVDLGQDAPTPGMSKQLVAACVVDTAVTGSLQFKVQDCATEGGSYSDLVVGPTMAAPVAGTVVELPLPVGACKRYLKVYFGGSPTGGKVRAFLTMGRHAPTPPAQADSIDNARIAE